MTREERQIVYTISTEGADESTQELQDVRAAAEGLREQVAALKEEPLKVAPEGELPKPPEEEQEAKKKPLLPRKKLKPEEEAAVARVSGMLSSGLVQGLKSGDVKGALAGVGTELAGNVASGLISKGIKSVLSMIPGFGMIASFLPFQEEGLVSRPTAALVGEREPEFIVTQERMRGLLSGGRSGYGFGPGDFGSAPNVNVGSPSVNVEVTMNPGVDADIQTAYRARAGEARLSQLEG